MKYQVSFDGLTTEYLETVKSSQAAALDESNPDSVLSSELFLSEGTSHVPLSPVSAAVPVAMSVTSVAKATYFVGEVWLPGSVTFKIDYSDGSVKYDNYNVGAKNTVMQGPGTHTMTFTYYGYENVTCTFDFKVRAEGSAPTSSAALSAATSAISSGSSSTMSIVSGAVRPIAISVVSVLKSTYYVGEYWAAGTVNFKIDYSDGSVKYDSHNVGVKNTLMKSPGMHTITFNCYRYENVSCTYSFTVLEGTGSSGSSSRPSANAVPVAMSIAALSKDTYYVGEDFDNQSISFKIDYSDGTSEYTNCNYGMSGFMSIAPGKVEVIFTVYKYENITCKHLFTIVAKEGTSSSASSGTSGTTSNTSSGTSSGTSSSTSSTASVAHTPENAVGTSVYITTPNKMVYHVGEVFDPTGMRISIQFPDGFFFVDGYTLSGFDSSKPGTVQLYIAYGKCWGGFTVTVVA